MTSQPPAPQYSPDGKFWWDGTSWQPVGAPPQAPAVPAQFPPGQPRAATNPPGTSQVGGAPGAGAAGSVTPFGPVAPYGPAGPFGPAAPFGPAGSYGPAGPASPRPGATPRRPSKTGFILALIGTLVATAVLGGIVGGVTGLVTTEPPGSDTPPVFASKFPNGARQYLPKVTLAAVVDDWLKKANAWKCADESAEDLFSGATKAMECHPPDDDGDMYVNIEYDAPDKVRVVRSTCRLGLKSKACTTLSSTLADAVLAPHGDELRAQAAKWATENAASERVTTIGGIRLEADLDAPAGMSATPGL